jgi:ribosomal protein S12 methylthiotransferase
VDDVEGSVAVARLSSQAPEIDGVVIIENEEGAVRPGDFVQVEIVDAYDYDLKGIVVGSNAAPAFLKRKVKN